MELDERIAVTPGILGTRAHPRTFFEGADRRLWVLSKEQTGTSRTSDPPERRTPTRRAVVDALETDGRRTAAGVRRGSRAGPSP